jgi:hypothetical protein
MTPDSFREMTRSWLKDTVDKRGSPASHLRHRLEMEPSDIERMMMHGDPKADSLEGQLAMLHLILTDDSKSWEIPPIAFFNWLEELLGEPMPRRAKAFLMTGK